MKPLQIGVLVLVGALGGAVIMKFTQRPKRVPAPIVSTAPAPAAVAEQAPVPVIATPAAAPIVPSESAAGESKLSPVAESAEAAPAPPKPEVRVRPARRAKPIRWSRPAVTTIARNFPPPAPPKAAVAPAPPPETTRTPAPEVPAAAAAAEPASVPPSPAAAPEPVEPPPPSEAPAPSVTLRAGMWLPIRVGEALSSEHNLAGDTFTATLDAPLTVDGFVIAERGARAEGRIVEVHKTQHMKGQAALVLELTRLNTSDGQHVNIQTDSFRKQPQSSTTQDVAMVAGAAGIGAIIGAIAGGGKGAGIGAAAGGAAGTGGVIATRSRAVLIPAETRLSFRLREPVTITEQLGR